MFFLNFLFRLNLNLKCVIEESWLYAKEVEDMQRYVLDMADHCQWLVLGPFITGPWVRLVGAERRNGTSDGDICRSSAGVRAAANTELVLDHCMVSNSTFPTAVVLTSVPVASCEFPGHLAPASIYPFSQCQQQWGLEIN